MVVLTTKIKKQTSMSALFKNRTILAAVRAERKRPALGGPWSRVW
jgi:hypothetical protein